MKKKEKKKIAEPPKMSTKAVPLYETKHTRRPRMDAYDKREVNERHRRAIGKRGRQIETAIAVASRNYDKRPVKVFESFRPLIEVGEFVRLPFVTTKQKVAAVHVCNDLQRYTAAWILIERSRRCRVKDRRRTRFVAYPAEDVQRL